MKSIVFKIDSDGEIAVEVRGAAGADCDTLTDPFEKSLGILSKKERKPEFFNQESESETAHAEGMGA